MSHCFGILKFAGKSLSILGCHR